MATSKYIIVKNNGDKIINYKTNKAKANKAFEKLKSKHKPERIESDHSLMNCVALSFETVRGTRWELIEEICPFGNL